MAVNEVIYNGQTLISLKNDTVTPETLIKGTTAHNAAGVLITGTHVPNSSPTQFTNYVEVLKDEILLNTRNNSSGTTSTQNGSFLICLPIIDNKMTIRIRGGFMAYNYLCYTNDKTSFLYSAFPDTVCSIDEHGDFVIEPNMNTAYNYVALSVVTYKYIFAYALTQDDLEGLIITINEPIGNGKSETWFIELEDGTTIEKVVFLGD